MRALLFFVASVACASVALFIVAALASRGAAAYDPPLDAALERARAAIDRGDLALARGEIDAIAAGHPKPDADLAADLTALRTRFAAKRKATFAGEAAARLTAILRREVGKKAAANDATYEGIEAWARKESIDACFEILSDAFRLKDASVTPEETRAFFEARPKTAASWREAPYGWGWGLIDPQKATGAERRAWYARASPLYRVAHWVASIVEKSGLFEVDPKRVEKKCPLCLGGGVITKRFSNGTSLSYLCPRCGGSKFDLAVRYR